ncbi:IclR family transcriptional regulator [Bacillus sp. DX1.1]|uniref:IclR family transcriptional regulator n=1 Tax=unclassified Bacillus (in: firmicutes) TaxID=185979 RepID=UPI00257116C8|nr:MULTISPECIES: IclR family transcriptional regulator [unclassified Bacillus (in: firmicutes)]MDM5155376.1 IclR family transcriptional regulator [Bacillus sp. DX1.1]WJE79691.1 IclR family transcriptional regulator [Bacillus sp. DX3.1]
MSLNKTAVKIMDILELFYEHQALTLMEMVKLTGMPKTSVYRLIGSLEEMGFLQKTINGTYKLGLVFLRFGQLVSDRLSLRNIAKPYMETLRADIGQAVNLIIQDGSEAIYIEKVDGAQPVRVYTAIGRRAPLYAGACPRILLTYFSKEEQEKYIEEVQLIQFAKGTILDKNQLRNMLQKAKSDGYTMSYSELENHTAAVAAPVFANNGKVIAGISISGLEIEYNEATIPQFIEKLTETAKCISMELGWREEKEGI